MTLLGDAQFVLRACPAGGADREGKARLNPVWGRPELTDDFSLGGSLAILKGLRG